MNISQISQLLNNCLGNIDVARNNAQNDIKNYISSNPENFAIQFSAYLLEENENAGQRQLAGVILKNSITITSYNINSQFWYGLSDTSRNTVKSNAMTALGTPEKMVRSVASSLISHIAAIELPRNMWPELVDVLYKNFNSADQNVRLACIQTTGYICEELIKLNNKLEDIPEQVKNNLVGVLAGSLDNENVELVLQTLKAVFNGFDFLQEYFAEKAKRDYIVRKIINFSKSGSEDVAIQSLMLLIHFICYNYKYIEDYINDIGNITFTYMRNVDHRGNTDVHALAIELWCTIIEEEYTLSQDNQKHFNIIQSVYGSLIPILCDNLLKASEFDLIEWNINVACSTCISLCAMLMGQPIVETVSPFVAQYIHSNGNGLPEVRAAVLVVGAVVDGPDHNAVIQLIRNTINTILGYLDPKNDESLRYASAWTLSRLCEYNARCCTNELRHLLECIVNGLKDVPRISSQCLYSLSQLASQFCKNGDNPHIDGQSKMNYNQVVNPHWVGVVKQMVSMLERNDVQDKENPLLASIGATVGAWIDSCQDSLLPCLPEFYVMFEQLVQKYCNIHDTTVRSEYLDSVFVMIYYLAKRNGNGQTNSTHCQSHMNMLLLIVDNGVCVTYDACYSILMLCNCMNTNYLEQIMERLDKVIAIFINSQNEKIIKGAFLLITNIIEIMEDSLNTQVVTRFLNYCLNALKDENLWQSNKIDAINTIGSIAMYCPTTYCSYIDQIMQQIVDIMTTCINYGGDDEEFISELRMSLMNLLTDNITMFDESEWINMDAQKVDFFKNAKLYYNNNQLNKICQYINALSMKGILYNPNNTQLFIDVVHWLSDVGKAFGDNGLQQLYSQQGLINNVINHLNNTIHTMKEIKEAQDYFNQNVRNNGNMG